MMKKPFYAVALLALSLPVLAASTTVYFPKKGVVCDKKSHFCADKTGISYPLTQKYLGKNAHDQLKKAMGDGKGVDLSSYTLSNGVYCDSKAKKCYKDRYYPHTKVENNTTKKLFN